MSRFTGTWSLAKAKRKPPWFLFRANSNAHLAPQISWAAMAQNRLLIGSGCQLAASLEGRQGALDGRAAGAVCKRAHARTHLICRERPPSLSCASRRSGLVRAAGLLVECAGAPERRLPLDAAAHLFQ